MKKKVKSIKFQINKVIILVHAHIHFILIANNTLKTFIKIIQFKIVYLLNIIYFFVPYVIQYKILFYH